MKKKLVQAVIQQVVEYRVEALLDEEGHLIEVLSVIEQIQEIGLPELVEVEYEIKAPEITGE